MRPSVAELQQASWLTPYRAENNTDFSYWYRRWIRVWYPSLVMRHLRYLIRQSRDRGQAQAGLANDNSKRNEHGRAKKRHTSRFKPC